MLTIHKIPLKNPFLTGIGSGYDKTPNQNEPQPFTSLSFTGDSLGVDYGKVSSNEPDNAFTGAEILCNSLTKPGVGLVLCSRDFDSIKSDFEIKRVKSNKFLQPLSSCGKL